MTRSESPISEQTADQRPARRRVRFELCASFILATLRWHSAPRDTDSPWHRVWVGLPYTFACLVIGPWGLPWGPVWTAVAVWTNLTGGVADDEP
ncbi:hypothetical protein J0H58_00325 [bacterium]|nr:hypothetical protein [bacterium]